MNTQLRPALVLFVLLSAITGIGYPLLVTGIAQAAFPGAANGSLVLRDGKPVGSALVGQNFDKPGYFWGRPSASGDRPDNAMASGGANLGARNPALADAVQARIAALRTADPGNTAAVPVGLVTSSGSGLDPEISPAAAAFQIGRVARARALPEASVRALVDRHTELPLLGFLGEPRINVLALNLALDSMRN